MIYEVWCCIGFFMGEFLYFIRWELGEIIVGNNRLLMLIYDIILNLDEG